MVSISNHTKQSLPAIDYDHLVTKILGRRYNLSIAFIGSHRSHQINLTYREKNHPTNVLAFPLEKTSGEILLDLTTAKKTAKKFAQDYLFHLNYLLIHGMLHLKGYDHGSTMEDEEKRLIKALKLQPHNHESPHRHGSRHRDSLNSRRRLRIQKRK